MLTSGATWRTYIHLTAINAERAALFDQFSCPVQVFWCTLLFVLHFDGSEEVVVE